jgi:HNH endonuclease
MSGRPDNYRKARSSRGLPSLRVIRPKKWKTIDDVFSASIPEPNSGCWLWMGNVDRKGYGRLGFRKNRNALAHRVTYKFLYGIVPAGLELDHLCRVPLCYNPAHLEPVTHQVNMRRSPLLATPNPRPRRRRCQSSMAQRRELAQGGGSGTGYERNGGMSETDRLAQIVELLLEALQSQHLSDYAESRINIAVAKLDDLIDAKKADARRAAQESGTNERNLDK